MILISIVGDFYSSILPVFFEFKDEIKKHIIVYESGNEKNFQRVLNGQNNFLQQSHNKYELITLEIDKFSSDKVNQCFAKIQSHKSNSQQIFLNATDSISFVTPTLIYKIMHAGHNIIMYNRYKNTYSIHSKNNISNHFITKNMDLKTHIQLKGYQLKSYTDEEILAKRKPFILQITKNLIQFKNFANSYKVKATNKGYYRGLIHKIGDNNEDFVKGKIFEEYIYWLIKDNVDYDDIMTGAVIEIGDNIQNEIDVLIIKNNHVHALECKFTDNFKTTEYIYKMDSIIDYLDHDGKGMILTVSDKYISHQDSARAMNSNIKIYSVKYFNKNNFIENFKQWFNLNKNHL